MIYEPKEDSFLLEKEVRKRARGKKVLDMGCGSGIQALAAKEVGAAEVLGVDVDKESVEICKEKGINAVRSDLFDNVSGRWDLIVFNPPYLPKDEREGYDLDTSGGEKGDEIIVRFLKDVGNYLEEGGKILLVVSSLTPRERIDMLVKKKKVVASEKFFMEELSVWLIFRDV